MMPRMLRRSRRVSPDRSSPRGSAATTPNARTPGGLTSRLSLLACVILFLASLTSADRNPVVDFCRRFGHQTAVIDRKLYIDGGFINYSPLPSNPTNFTNTFLAYQDLDHDGSGGMPQLYANLSKNATIPSVNGGFLWADDVNKKFYLFGGEYYQAPPSALALYSYDTLYDVWNTMSQPPPSIYGVSYGAGVSVSELGQGYYYGGWLSNNSVPNWTGGRVATTGLINYDMDQNQWTNITGPDKFGRAEGVMVYIPVSDGGMLVYFGGVQDSGNGTMVGQPMDQIFVFDIASSKWYNQNATGDVPQMRARFCAGVAWAPDFSSYNIYLYGGAGMPPNTAGFDDVYILSMPSFTWIKMYGLEQYPHNTLTCNVIDGAQMIIIGGTFPLDDTECDAAPQFGSHGLDMGEQNPDSSPWAVYRKNITSYVVPSPVTNVIGGSSQGAATKTSPDGGFGKPDLKVLMARRFTAPTRQPTRDISLSTGSSPPVLSHGAIAGIAVGGAVALIGIAVLAWFCLRKKRRQESNYRYEKPGTLAPSHSRTNSGGGTLTGYPTWSSPGSSHNAPMSPMYGPGQVPAWNPHSPLHQPYPEQHPYSRQHGTGPIAVIPEHPIEMPGNAYDVGASEAYVPPFSVPKSPTAISANGTGTTTTRGSGDSPMKRTRYVSGQTADYSGEEWQPNSPTGTLQRSRTRRDTDDHDYSPGLSPVTPRAHHHPQGFYQHRRESDGSPQYADGGYGPRELSGDAPPPLSPMRCAEDGDGDGDTGRRHNTYYHK